MLNFIITNLSTIFVAAVVAVILIAVALQMRRDKKKGKSACGGNCSKCSRCP